MQFFLPNSPRIVHFETKNRGKIGRAAVLCNNAELVNPSKARPRRVREHPTSGTGHRGQMSAGQISGSNPDEMDGEGAAFGRSAGSITLHIAHSCRGCISMCRC